MTWALLFGTFLKPHCNLLRFQKMFKDSQPMWSTLYRFDEKISDFKKFYDIVWLIIFKISFKYAKYFLLIIRKR